MKKIIMTAVILASINYAVKAQPGSTTGGFDDEPVDVPVDGGILLLAAAGAFYGLRKKEFRLNMEMSAECSRGMKDK